MQMQSPVSMSKDSSEKTGNNLASGSSECYGSVGGSTESVGQWVSDTARWLESSKDTDPANVFAWCCHEDFKPRKLKAPLVLLWLLSQALGIICQLCLYSETARHLSAYEDTLTIYCGLEHQRSGICLGPNWNLTYSSVLNFPPMQSEDSRSDFDFVIPADRAFSFRTASQPPTFLLGIEPQEPHAKAHWKVAVGAASDGKTPEKVDVVPATFGTGTRYKVVVGPASASGSWLGSLQLKSKFSESANIRVYVVDSKILHLADVHKQPQCSFEDSWQNFNERHNGEHHKVLSNTLRATGFFLMVSFGTFAAMFHRFYFYIESGKLMSRVVAFKFIAQDFPQQLCIVFYLYGWYAQNGLRCQMCLFHPEHCDDEHPLHFFNLLVCIFTLLSATSNQLLLQAKSKHYDEEEEFFLVFARSAIFSVSILPFSSGMFFLSASLFHLRSPLVYLITGIPALVGWGALFCVPTMTLCEEELLV